MTNFSVKNLSRRVNFKNKKLLVTFVNFGQVTLVIFRTLGQLALFAAVTLLCWASHHSNLHYIRASHAQEVHGETALSFN